MYIVFMNVDALEGTCTYTCVHLEAQIWVSSLITLHFIYWDRRTAESNLLTWTNVASQLVQEQGAPISAPGALGLQVAAMSTWLLHRFWKFRFWFSLTRQVLSPPSWLPNPPLHLLLPSSYHLFLISVGIFHYLFSHTCRALGKRPGLVSDFYPLFPVVLLYLTHSQGKRTLWLVVAPISSLDFFTYSTLSCLNALDCLSRGTEHPAPKPRCSSLLWSKDIYYSTGLLSVLMTVVDVLPSSPG